MAYSGQYEDGYDAKYGYNRNAFKTHTPLTFVLSKVLKVITTPLGLASEALAHKKSKGEKAAATVEPSQASDPVGPDAAQDESDWALDEISGDVPAEAPPEYDVVEVEIEGHAKLPYPVVIPQRRPGTKTRGFVHAYAPILRNSGISQTAFLSFLDELYKAQQASPILKVIEISASLASMSPEIISASVATAIFIAAKAAEEVQERWQTNTYLEQANQEIFMPQGLYAMIVRYKPVAPGVEDSISLEEVDLKSAQGVARYGESGTDSTMDTKKIQDRLRIASTETHGVPVTCAQLIFPTLDAKFVSEGGSTNLVGTAQRSSIFVNDYFDRRARMHQATDDPDGMLTQLSGGKPQFESKMGDPNDARNRHLITLLTGGLIKAEPLGARRRWEQAQRKEQAKMVRIREKQSAALAQGGTFKMPSAHKKIMQEDILYLMVVNMPDEEQLSRAREALAARRG